MAPLGDVAAAPLVLEWAPVSGAVAYDVEVLEVDRAPLWRAATASSRIELPSGVVAMLVPGKTMLWDVAARSAAGAVVAESGVQQFRVATVAGTGRNP